MAKPTEEAEHKFSQAQSIFVRGLLDNNPIEAQRAGFQNLQAGLINMCDGLQNLSVGVRATYILLEEVKGLLQRQGKAPYA